MTADASTLPAIAAFVAAAVALIVGLRSSEAANKSAQAALMSAKNAGRYRVAEFRQQWIDNVIETLSAYHAMEATRLPLSTTDDERSMSALRTKLEILLNPEETDTIDVLAALDRLSAAADPGERAAHDAEVIRISRQLLKREWARIKTELG